MADSRFVFSQYELGLIYLHLLAALNFFCLSPKSDVTPHHAVVVKPDEAGEEVVGEENVVVIAHDEPAHAGETEAEGLGDNARDADGGA
jgi:hypothetical protein